MCSIIVQAVSSGLTSICSLCHDTFIRKATHINRLEDNLDDLQTALEDLRKARDDLLVRVVQEEQRRRMVRSNQVQLWLSRVESAEDEVDELISNSSQQIERLCLGGFCSNDLKTSYEYGKIVAKTLQTVNALIKSEKDFKEVAQMAPMAAIDILPVDPIIVGQESMLDSVWKCLVDGQAGIIGIYGMGGVGKTTLLKQINNRFRDSLLGFKFVFWVVVSRNPQIQSFENIQNDIGKKLGFCEELWEKKKPDDKARDIYNTLSNQKFVLLLDDLGEWLDLTTLGIPIPKSADRISSNIVFTTRFVEVCAHMRADEYFELESLTPEEAYTLFEKSLRKDILTEHPSIYELAKEVVEHCRGLPAVIIKVSQSMADKETPQEWEEKLEELKSRNSKLSAGRYGEDDEDAILDMKSKLYAFDKESQQWNDRCVGHAKLLKHKTYGFVRFVMREDKTLRIRANHQIPTTIDIGVHSHSDKACVWFASDYTYGQLKDEFFCLRFVSVENCRTFMESVRNAVKIQRKQENAEMPQLLLNYLQS